MSNKPFDDISGFMNGLAGLANDTRRAAQAKFEEIRSFATLKDEVKAMEQRIAELEVRMEKYESAKDQKVKK